MKRFFRCRPVLICMAGVWAFLTTMALLHGHGMQGEANLFSIFFFGLFLFYGLCLEKEKTFGSHPVLWIPAGLFAVFAVAGHLYLREIPAGILRMGVCFLGYAVFYKSLAQGLIWLLESKLPNNQNVFGYRILCRHPAAVTLALLVLFWTVPFVVKYPAGFCMDALTEMRIYYEELPRMNQHPVLHVILLGKFYDFGLALGSRNLGFFLFALVQTLVLGLIVSYGIRLLVRLKVPMVWTLGALAFFLLSPFVTGYVGVIIKDNYFVAFFLLFVILTAEWILTGERFWNSRWKIGFWIFSALGMSLSRVNVLLLLAPTVALMLFFSWKGEKRIFRSSMVLLVLLVPYLANLAVTAVYQPVNSGKRESFSLPLQQTARFAKYHDDQVTEEEKRIISKVVPYDQLAQWYDPYLSDMVKGHFQGFVTNEELMDYFGVWLRQFFREPGCYLGSFLQQNVFLFYPEYNNYTYYFGNETAGDYMDSPQALEGPRALAETLTNLMHKLPVLVLINNSAVGCMIFVVLCFYAGSRKKWDVFLCLIPGIAVLLGILLGPTILENARYTFPVLYTLPFLLPVVREKMK